MIVSKSQQMSVSLSDGTIVRMATVEPPTGGSRVTVVDMSMLSNYAISASKFPGMNSPVSAGAVLRLAKLIEQLDSTADRVCVEHGDFRPAPSSNGTIEAPPATCPSCRAEGGRNRTRSVEADR